MSQETSNYGLPLAHKSLATYVVAERHRRDGHAAGFEPGHSTRPPLVRKPQSVDESIALMGEQHCE
jgi:hypothetical protein